MLEPVAATVLAIAVLGEPAGPTTILGIAITLAGVWIASTVRSKQPAAIGTVNAETAAPDPRHARPSRGPARAGCTLPAVSAILHEAVAVGNAASRSLGMGAHPNDDSAVAGLRSVPAMQVARTVGPGGHGLIW